MTIIHLPARTRNCQQPGADPDAWFPDEPDVRDTQERAAYEETARTLCAGCPFRAECLEDALRFPEQAGIWGGTAPWWRRALRRSRMAVAS